MLTALIIVIQLVVTLIIGYYFFKQLRGQSGKAPAQNRGSSLRELEHLNLLRAVRLSEPLNERVRPATFDDIIGQNEGVKALKAILCSPNPQHVIIYGPPGIGKTCAARLVLNEARGKQGTPFRENAPFIEMDATCVRFDERSIADPLIGSVHDPIYQGAGQLGINGIPQPKEGAVTRAHGGVLFLDEIGELHPTQMNKLLKVLEDRKVQFESAYYNPDDTSVPRHIHDIFKNGLPADFRLVGATTRSPSELPPALRSRCMEVYFRPLESDELAQIALGAANKATFALTAEEADRVGQYAGSGREAVNIVQMAAGIAQMEGRNAITRGDIEWVLDSCHYSIKAQPKKVSGPKAGVINGLAVHGLDEGSVMEIEVVAVAGSGKVTVTGIIEEEEMGDNHGRKMRRKSMAKGSSENVLTVLKKLGLEMDELDLHINFPGGVPVDGPSAGAAMTIASWSAVTGVPIKGDIAVTGEITVRGDVYPVGGVPAKAAAAVKAGMTKVLIPADNWQDRFNELDAEIVPITGIEQAIKLARIDGASDDTLSKMHGVAKPVEAIAAQSVV